MKILSSPLIACLFSLSLLGACAELPTPSPVLPTPVFKFTPGPIPDGTIYIRDERGRILFSAPTDGYGRGREIRIHAYDHNGRLNATIENQAGAVVQQRLRGNYNHNLSVFYNRSLGGFKLRNMGDDNLSF